MASKKYILWDFDGTLAYRRGKWSGTLAEIANEFTHQSNFTYDDFHSIIAKRFFWSYPEREHPHLSDPDRWWAALQPVFEDTFQQVGFTESYH